MELTWKEVEEIVRKAWSGELDNIFKSPYPVITYSDHQMYPEACKNCSNNLANGGSGICHCTLGQLKITF